jgi:hypothetical protein
MASLRFLSNEIADALYELMYRAAKGEPKNTAAVTKQKLRISRAIQDIARQYY